ncbi:MAG: DUF2318 domain-containing protein [Clostridia bacterium]|nr:DUF2318 domain-containing protein [Clostridia bacterium]
MMRKSVLFLLICLCVILAVGCAPKEKETADEASEQTVFAIALDDLNNEPAFFDWVQENTPMQVIAMVDGEGQPRLAYNTCQSCGGSPYAYFEYLGDHILQCQNCGLIFLDDTVGTPRAAGCNPYTISDFDVSDGMITVAAEELSKAVPLFANWKVFE